MKLCKMVTAWVLLMLWAALPAAAETLPGGAEMYFPADTTLTGTLKTDGLVMYELEDMQTGEQLLFTFDEQARRPVSLATTLPADRIESDEPQGRESALEVLNGAYPEAAVLFVTSDASGAYSVGFLTESLGGTVDILGELILSRSLTYGTYLEDGRLSLEGARVALILHRPQAEIDELELDDDEPWIYEGEAYVNGVEYEFEIDARTGKLLEWERD